MANLILGKQSKLLMKELKGILNIKKSLISKVINKYGIDNFNISIIDEADTRKELSEKEVYWIKELNSKAPNGYNLAEGGNGGDLSNYIEYSPCSQETKDKISKKLTGVPLSEETKEKLKGRTPWNKGKINCFSSKTINKMSESHKGQITWIKGKDMKALGYISSAKGKLRPDIAGENNPAKRPEVREKISKANKGMVSSKGNLGKKYPYKSRPKAKGRIAWNKDLTKETDERVMQISKTEKETKSKNKKGK